VPWFREHDVALFGGDCIERLPSGYALLPLPFHALALAAMGLAILDNVDMERLREACSSFDRSAFLLVVAPLPIEGATGSAVNPLAIF
jgi:kynurenine formamidase